MKKIIFLFLLFPVFLMAQQNPLFVEGVSPSLYLMHKVAPKENYYSIGRIYNASPKDIAPFNKLQLESGLSLGQIIKIPLNSSNFFQEGNAEADETFVPLYYKIKDKEGLYRVAKNHNDLPLEKLKQWNSIKGDAVKTGTQLIVGYLKVKTELSALAKSGIRTSIGSAVSSAAEPIKTPEPAKVAEPEKEPAQEIVSKPIVENETKKTRRQARKEKEAAAKTEVTEEKADIKPAKETPITA